MRPNPVHPDVLERERQELSESYATTKERPVFALIAVVLNFGLVTYVVFRAINGFGRFNPSHWLSDILMVIFIGSWLGLIIAVMIMGVGTAVMSGLSRLLTGKGMFPSPSSHQQHLEDPYVSLVWLAGLAGVPVAEIVWVLAGLLR
jgi:hypothetical protein